MVTSQSNSARKGPRSKPGRNAGSGRRQHIYSALDLGTNNCRLLIAKPVAGGFKVIDAFSRVVRLGEGLASSGRLSEAAQQRTIDALKVCASKIRRRRATRMRHVATEACRSAENCGEFVSRVWDETGLMLDVITPAEEARLAVMGCQSLLDAVADYALVFDIGGGSTELVLTEIDDDGPKIRDWASIPVGVVNLSERYGADAITHGIYREIRGEVARHLDGDGVFGGLKHLPASASIQLLGTSGTVTTLASLHLGLERYDRDRVDGTWIEVEDLLELASMLISMSSAERARQPCIGPERADLVIAGCAILEAVFAKWPISRLRVADRGIREGVLRGLMRRDPLVNGASEGRRGEDR